MAATCAFILLEAMSTSNVTTGSAAARVDAVALLNGSYTWLHIHPASMAFRFDFQIREYRRLSLTESGTHLDERNARRHRQMVELRPPDHLIFGLRSSCERAEFMLALVLM